MQFDINGFILRDASLRDAPQDEVFFLDEVLFLEEVVFLEEALDPHGEERVFARLEP
jgi:hypothetical protein